MSSSLPCKNCVFTEEDAGLGVNNHFTQAPPNQE